jgi:phenylpropionate dioxygenase-like ring-hydroxylating dioxygenase large terminal subunit
MPFLQNCWYVAGWSSDLDAGPIPRTLAGHAVLLYRDAVGAPRAIGNRCPHRFAPLDRGTLIDDTIECGYHGLRFNGRGACVFNPHPDGAIAANMRVPAWPLAERSGLLWFWPGDPALADPAAIIEIDRLVNPAYAVIRGTMRVEAGYQLLVDNLLDLSHTQFLHAAFLAAPGFLDTEHAVTQTGEVVFSERYARDIVGPATFTRNLTDPAARVDHWQRAQWDAPGICRLDVGVTPTGRPEHEGIRSLGVHLATPETATSAHYFYAAVRNYGIDDPDLDERARTWHRIGFGEQDKPMIEAVQRMMGGAEFTDLHPVLLSSDGAALRARNIMRKRIAREAASAPALEGLFT